MKLPESPKIPEQEYLRSLFMNEKESDIAFKIQDKTIHAHKQVLIAKSKFFANLFNSIYDTVFSKIISY